MFNSLLSKTECSHAQLVPTNEGRQAQLYVGYQWKYTAGIWEFTVNNSTRSWQGQLLEEIEEHAVLAVFIVRCQLR